MRTPVQQLYSILSLIKKSLFVRCVREGEVGSPGNTNCGHKRLEEALAYRGVSTGRHGTYDLELDGDDPEVQHLYKGPEHVVCLQRRQIDVLQFPTDGSLSASFGDSHEGKKTGET
jgi:hypothetical protein